MSEIAAMDYEDQIEELNKWISKKVPVKVANNFQKQNELHEEERRQKEEVVLLKKELIARHSMNMALLKPKVVK